jgi:hypothetical protein
MAEKENREIPAKEKQQLAKPQEQTRPGRFYVPDVNIYEFENSLKLWADMPGVRVRATLAGWHEMANHPEDASSVYPSTSLPRLLMKENEENYFLSHGHSSRLPVGMARVTDT